MNNKEILNYIQNPVFMDIESLEKIKALIKKYPYFQTAYLLFAKNKQINGDASINSEFNFLSTFVSDRNILYRTLYSEEIKEDIANQLLEVKSKSSSLNKVKSVTKNDETKTNKLDEKAEADLKAKKEAEQKEKTEAELKAKKEAEQKEKAEAELKAKKEAEQKEKAEAELKAKKEAEQKEKTEAELKAKKEAEQKEKAEAELKAKKEEVIERSILEINEKPETTLTENDDFIEFTIERVTPENEVNTSDKLIDKKDITEKIVEDPKKTSEKTNKEETLADKILREVAQRRSKKLDEDSKKKALLINSFINKSDNLEPIKVQKTDSENKAEKSIKEIDDFVSERLAKLYVNQKFYNKAISAYEKLILKNPEKNTYFANQIKKVKKMQEEVSIQ